MRKGYERIIIILYNLFNGRHIIQKNDVHLCKTVL